MLQLKLICVLILSITSVLGENSLNCYTCDNTKECKKDNVKSKECLEGDTCSTIFDVSKSNLIKGCSSDLKEECSKSEKTCFQCTTNQCNIAEDLTDYHDCVSCNSKDNENCALGRFIETKKCYKSCMARVVVDEKTNTYNLIRSCLDEIEESKQKDCVAGTDKHCKVCDTDSCNKDMLSDTIPQCFHCEDPTKCKNAASRVCKTYDPTCYAIYNELASISSLGCLSSLNKFDVQKLKDNNQIFTCMGLDCNKYDIIPKREQCSLCDSKTDSKCAQSPDDMKATTVCDILGNIACFTKVASDKSTSRGCWKNLSEQEKSECKTVEQNATCGGCIGPLCNNKIFPENRKICHICDSATDPSCATTEPNKAQACLLYDKDDKCVSKLENKITYRGCTSKFEHSCAGTDRTCRKCNMNKCNVIDLEHKINDSSNNGIWQDLPLTCLSCDGDNCKNEKTTLPANCEENQEDCITVFNKEDAVIMRGCEHKVFDTYEQYCAQNPNVCFNCKSNNCNIATSVKNYTNCIYCGWPNGPSCIDIDSNKINTYAQRSCYNSCMTALYPNSEIGDTYDLIRTCTDDKLPEDQKICTQINDENNLNTSCLTCTGENCNTSEYPKNRTNCYMCNNIDNCEKPKSNKCPLYRNNDDCYYIYNEDQVIRESGCTSSLQKKTIDELLIQNKIGLCNGINCNSYDNKPKDNKCVICDSKTDVNCATNPDKITKEVTCKAPISSCFMRVNKDGITERGCLLTLEDEIATCNSTSDIFCKSCNSNSTCNKQIFPQNRRACQVCSSKGDATCHNNPNSVQICPQYFPDEKCVSTFKNKITERGCGQTLKCDDEKNKKTCEICDSNNCNSVNLRKKNGSAAIICNTMIISLLSFGLIFFSK